MKTVILISLIVCSALFCGTPQHRVTGRDLWHSKQNGKDLSAGIVCGPDAHPSCEIGINCLLGKTDAQRWCSGALDDDYYDRPTLPRNDMDMCLKLDNYYIGGTCMNEGFVRFWFQEKFK